MLNTSQIIRSFRFYLRHNPSQLLLLFIVTLLAGFNQGASIVILIPLLSTLSKDASSSSPIIRFMHNAGFTPSINAILIIFVVLLIATAILSYIKARMQSKYEQEFIYSIRTRLFRKIISTDWLTINRMSKHNHIQVITNEIPKMVSYYYSMLRFICGALIIGAHIFLSLFISVSFTMMVLLIGLLSFWALRKFLHESAALGSQQLGSYRKMMKEVDDFWIMIKQAKIHNTESFYFDRFCQTNQQTRAIQNRQSIRRAVSQLLFTIIGVAALAIIVYISITLQHTSIPSLLVLIILFARIYPLFVNANNDLNQLLSSLSSTLLVIKTDEELQEKQISESHFNSNAQLAGDIALENITFGYTPNIPIFKNLTILFPMKSMTGIYGASGSGKTTLVDIISGLITPQSGTIRIGDVSIDDKTASHWRQAIGYLPQDTFFVDGTIRENLIWDSGRDISDAEIYATLEKVNAKAIVEKEPLALSTSIANYHYHFSGGERQRLALARVLLKQPRLLLLDEATSALDSTTEQQIMDNLSRLKGEITIIFITHRQNLRSYFDHTIDFGNGIYLN